MRSYYFFSLFTIVLCLASGPLTAQNQKKIDSLKQQLQQTKTDDRFTILNELFKAYNAVDYSAALGYADDYYDFAMAKGDSVKIVGGGRMRAYALMDLARSEEAAEVLNITLGIARRNEKKYPELKGQIKFILNNAGLASMNLGNYDKALDFHYKSLVIREEEGDKKSIRTALNNIGLVFYSLKDYDKAIENYLRAVSLSKEINDFNGLERIYINLGLSYNQLHKFNEAIKYFEVGFKVCGENCDDGMVKEGLEGLGFAQFENKQINIAKQNFLKSLAIARKQNDKRYTCENLGFLGRIELRLNHDKEGLAYLNEAEILAESLNLAEFKLSIYKELADYYGKKKEYERSLNYQTKYAQFKDSIYSDLLIKNITKVQTNYDQRENLKTIAEKNQVLALQKEVIARTRQQYVFISTIACLITMLAAMSFYFSRLQRKVNRELSSAKNKIEEQNMRLAAYNKELEIKVHERTVDLNLSNRALQQVNDELDNFIYRTSHDIRGPIATLKGICGVALIDVKDSIAITYLRRIDETAERMNIILTRLMIVNQINGSLLELGKVNLKDVLNDIFAVERKKECLKIFRFLTILRKRLLSHPMADWCGLFWKT